MSRESEDLDVGYEARVWRSFRFHPVAMEQLQTLLRPVSRACLYWIIGLVLVPLRHLVPLLPHIPPPRAALYLGIALSLAAMFGGVGVLAIILSNRHLEKRLSSATLYLENGTLVIRSVHTVRKLVHKSEVLQFSRIKLMDVREAYVGYLVQPEYSCPRIKLTWGRVRHVLTLDDMEAFVSEVSDNLPIRLVRTNERMSFWTAWPKATAAFFGTFYASSLVYIYFVWAP